MRGNGGPVHPKLSHLLGHFTGHVMLGTAGFIALAIPPIILSLAAHYLEETPISSFVIDVLLVIHYFLLVVDALLFVSYILAAGYDTAIELIGYVKGVRRDWSAR
jgi:hypothetical protein